MFRLCGECSGKGADYIDPASEKGFVPTLAAPFGIARRVMLNREVDTEDSDAVLSTVVAEMGERYHYAGMPVPRHTGLGIQCAQRCLRGECDYRPDEILD
jgi:hypothetical protein